MLARSALDVAAGGVLALQLAPEACAASWTGTINHKIWVLCMGHLDDKFIGATLMNPSVHDLITLLINVSNYNKR